MVAVAHQRILTSLNEMRSIQREHGRTPAIFDSVSLASNLSILKISGKLCEPENLGRLAEQIKELTGMGKQFIMIPGGGIPLDKALAAAGIATTKKDGKRITPPEAMPIVANTLAGVSEQVSELLISHGISVALINGRNRSAVRAKALDGYGRTGSAESIDTRTIESLLLKCDVLVLCCLGHDEFGALNVNADDVARAVGEATRASSLVLFSDVPGVFGNANDKTSIIPRLTRTMAERMISDGTINNGMIEKVRQCTEAVQNGVGEVILADPTISLLDLTQGRGVCTRFLSV